MTTRSTGAWARQYLEPEGIVWLQDTRFHAATSRLPVTSDVVLPHRTPATSSRSVTADPRQGAFPRRSLPTARSQSFAAVGGQGPDDPDVECDHQQRPDRGARDEQELDGHAEEGKPNADHPCPHLPSENRETGDDGEDPQQ